MPTDRLHITKVFDGWHAKNGVTRWDILTRESFGVYPDMGQIITAVSFHAGDKGQLYASACVAAAKTGAPLLIQWRDTRYGREVVQIEPVPQETEAA